MTPIWVAAVFAVVLLAVVVGFLLVETYNAVISLRQRIDKAWANIDVVLKQRHDQLPALVSAVRGALQFEQDVLTEVARARAAYSSTEPIPDQAVHAEQTSAAVRSLFAVVEQYPAVRSQENVLDLQNEIERLEGMIADRRELYNDQVYRYNTRIATFPTLLIAPLFGWRARPLFVATPEEAAVPEIDRMTVQQGADAPVERQIWLVRHGETEWARLGRHTGRTDIPLTEAGRSQARALGRRIGEHPFSLVLTSPLSRAAETATIAGFPDAVRDPDLQEWDYGALEGRTTPDIRTELPTWTIWSGPWPRAETPDEVGTRVNRVIARCLDPDVEGDALLFAHGHLLRILAARWLRLPATSGSMFALGTATIGILGWDRDNPVIELWNEGSHLVSD